MHPTPVISIAAPSAQPYAMLDPVRDYHPSSLSRVFSVYGCCAKDLCSSLFKKCMFWRKEESPELRAAAQPLAPGDVSPLTPQIESQSDFETLIEKEKPGCLSILGEKERQALHKAYEILRKTVSSPIVLIPTLAGAAIWLGTTISKEGQFMHPAALVGFIIKYSAHSLFSKEIADVIDRVCDFILPFFNFCSIEIAGYLVEGTYGDQGDLDTAFSIGKGVDTEIGIFFGSLLADKAKLMSTGSESKKILTQPTDLLYKLLLSQATDIVTKLKAHPKGSEIFDDVENTEDLTKKLLISSADFTTRIQAAESAAQKKPSTIRKICTTALSILPTLACLSLSWYASSSEDTPLHEYSSSFIDAAILTAFMPIGAWLKSGVNKWCDTQHTGAAKTVAHIAKPTLDIMSSLLLGLVFTPESSNILMNAATGLTGGIIIQNAIDKQRIEKLYEEKQKIMESIINDFKTKLLEMIEKNKEHLSTKEFNELKAILDQATTSSKQWLEKSYFGLLLMFAIIFPFYIKNYGPPKSDSMVDFWRTSAHLWTSVFAWLTSSFIKNSDYITAMPIISLIFYWYTTAIIQTLEKNNPTMHPGHPLLENWMRMKCILIGIANGISQYFVYHKKLSGPNHTQNRALLAQTGNVFSRVAAQVAKKDYT